jgi:hypothetical protein
MRAAAASLAVRTLLEGPDRPARILGVTERAAWLEAEGSVLVLTDAVRLPNAVLLRLPPRAPTAGSARVGGGRLILESIAVNPVRWWDPRPALGRASVPALSGRVGDLGAALGASADAGLVVALSGGDPAALTRAALPLIGSGEGLTPEGDDLLAGAAAAFRLLARATGGQSAAAVLDAAGPGLLAASRLRTTSLSTTLLGHALRGETPAPVGSLLQALAGHGDLAVALAALLRLGHTSGKALAIGVLTGATALVPQPGRP